MNWLAVVGDALWILCLSFMSGASRTAGKRIPGDVTVPVWTIGAKPVRVNKTLALWALPTVATLVGLFLSAMSRRPPADPVQPLVILGMRTVLAPVLVMGHLGQLRSAIDLLQSEGKLRS